MEPLSLEQIVVKRPDGSDASNGSTLCKGHLDDMVKSLPEKYPSGGDTYRTIHLPPAGVSRG
jgi:hypothetical protein